MFRCGAYPEMRVGYRKDGEKGGGLGPPPMRFVSTGYFFSVAAMASRACSMRYGWACVPMCPRRKTLPSIGPKLPVQISPWRRRASFHSGHVKKMYLILW